MPESFDETLLTAIERYKQSKETPEDRKIISEALASKQIEIEPAEDSKIIRQAGGASFGESNVIRVSGSVIGTQNVTGFTAKQVLDLIEERNKPTIDDSKTYTINTPANRGCSPTIVIIASISAVLVLIGGLTIFPLSRGFHLLGQSPTPTPQGYVDCTNPSITEHVFPQLEQVTLNLPFLNTLVRPFVSSNMDLICTGVNDVFHSSPLSVRIEYYNYQNQIAYWGISTQKGFDASRFENICFWVLSRKPNQSLLLNLVDIDSAQSRVQIDVDSLGEWKEICTKLINFSNEGVDLKRIRNFSLIFSSGTGIANLWVDDFEYR